MFIKLAVMDDFAWRDVFDFVSLIDDRKKVALISGFGDRKFSGICQKWLHEWAKDIRIDILSIYKNDNGELVALNGKLDKVALADTELPANICDFREIEIHFMDSKVLQFLRRMQPLFRGVKLHVRTCQDEESLEATRTMLGHMLPLITGGIEAVRLNTHQSLLLTIRGHLPTQQILGIKRLDLDVRDPSEDDGATLAELLHRWLGTRLAGGQPKIVELSHCFDDGFLLVLGLLERIRQNFPNETSQASFFIRCLALSQPCFGVIQESTTQNAGTNEQLLIRKPEDWVLLIGRCLSELDGQKWLEEMDNKMDEQNLEALRRITVLFPKLGQIEEPGSGGEHKDDDDDVHQPGPNKEPKLE